MLRRLFAELRRRNVIRAAILYIGAVWALAQGISQLGPSVGAPEWTTRWFLVAAIIGFPFWIAFAWFFEFTPEGLKRESEIAPDDSITAHTGRKLDFVIIGVMAVAIVLLLTDRFVLRHGVNQESAAAISEQSIRGAAVRRHEPGQGSGVFLRWYLGRTAEPAGEDSGAPRRGAHVVVFVQGQGSADPGDREDAAGRSRAGRLDPQVRRSGADHGAAGSRFGRLSAVVRDIRPQARRHLQDQDEIAGKVVDELKVTLLGAAPKVRTTDPKAYALYLQARQLGRQATPEAFAKSDDLYHQVLAIDPRYAPAWHGLAGNFYNETSAGMLSSQDGFARAREAMTKALEIDPEYAPAHGDLGWIAIYGDNDLAAAAKHFERALALDPADLDVLGEAATLLADLGRLDQALALEAAIVRRDPVNVTVLQNLGSDQHEAGRYDDAIASLRAALSLSPGRRGAHFYVGIALLRKGDAAGALAEIEQETSEAWRMIGVPMVYHALGRTADSDKALTALIDKSEKDGPYNIAYVYAFRGETDKAFEWLDKAIEYKDPGLGEIVLENLFDSVRSDPRWLPFLRKIGKAPEQLAKIEFKVTLPKEWQAESTAESAAKSATTAN